MAKWSGYQMQSCPSPTGVRLGLAGTGAGQGTLAWAPETDLGLPLLPGWLTWWASLGGRHPTQGLWGGNGLWL